MVLHILMVKIFLLHLIRIFHSYSFLFLYIVSNYFIDFDLHFFLYHYLFHPPLILFTHSPYVSLNIYSFFVFSYECVQFHKHMSFYFFNILMKPIIYSRANERSKWVNYSYFLYLHILEYLAFILFFANTSWIVFSYSTHNF